MFIICLCAVAAPHKQYLRCFVLQRTVRSLREKGRSNRRMHFIACMTHIQPTSCYPCQHLCCTARSGEWSLGGPVLPVLLLSNVYPLQLHPSPHHSRLATGVRPGPASRTRDTLHWNLFVRFMTFDRFSLNFPQV